MAWASGVPGGRGARGPGRPGQEANVWSCSGQTLMRLRQRHRPTDRTSIQQPGPPHCLVGNRPQAGPTKATCQWMEVRDSLANEVAPRRSRRPGDLQLPPASCRRRPLDHAGQPGRQEEAHGAQQADDNEHPEEDAVDDHGHVLPVLLHLQTQTRITAAPAGLARGRHPLEPAAKAAEAAGTPGPR